MKRDYDLEPVTAAVIVSSDRVLAQERPDRAGPVAVERLRQAGVGTVSSTTVAEGQSAVVGAIDEALATGARLVLVLGGTGFGVGNEAPEAVRSRLAVEIPGVAEQIRAHGLESTPLSGLSRVVVGVTARDATGALLVASPGSVGGVSDSLDVLVPLLGAVLAQLDETR